MDVNISNRSIELIAQADGIRRSISEMLKQTINLILDDTNNQIAIKLYDLYQKQFLDQTKVIEDLQVILKGEMSHQQSRDAIRHVSMLRH